MQPVDHILEYYRTKVAGADAADWPHVHLAGPAAWRPRARANRSLVLHHRTTRWGSASGSNKLARVPRVALLMQPSNT
jgi:hypothetical protein